VLSLGLVHIRPSPDETVPPELFGCLVEGFRSATQIGPREYVRLYERSPLHYPEHSVFGLYRRVLRAARDHCETRAVVSSVARPYASSLGALAGLAGLGAVWFRWGRRRAAADLNAARRAIAARTKADPQSFTTFLVEKLSGGGRAERAALAVIGDRALVAPLSDGDVSAIPLKDVTISLVESNDSQCRAELGSRAGIGTTVRFDGAVDLVRFVNLIAAQGAKVAYRYDA
jgi:hypothetical protein